MKEPQPPETPKQNREQLAKSDEVLLQRAVEKLVRLGQQVCVKPEDIISLLDSGMSIRELLVYLSSKAGNA